MNRFNSLKEIAVAGNLSKLELRLTLILLGLCNISGQCLISLADLTELLNTSKGNISTALANLVSKNIITRLDSNNRGRGAKSYHLEINFDNSKYPFSSEYDPLTDSANVEKLATLEKKLNKEVRANKTLREENRRLSKIEPKLKDANQKIQELQDENKMLKEKKSSWFGIKH